MKKLVLVSALGLVALAGTGIAAVQAQQPGPGKHFHHANWRDGGDRHHRPHDGARMGMMRQLMEQADADKDGALTQAEIDGFRNGQIAKYDTDKNGSLSLSEYEALWMDQMRERMVRAFQRNDPDGNGQVTTAEFGRRFDNIVERMDRNGDGKLSRDDRRGWRHGPPPAADDAADDNDGPDDAPEAAPQP